MPHGKVENASRAPRLPNQDRPLRAGPECARQRPEVLGDRCEVVAGFRLVRMAMAAKIDGNGRATGLDKPPRNPVPQPRVGSQSVNQQERRRGLQTGLLAWRRASPKAPDGAPLQDAQFESAGHLDAPIDRTYLWHHNLLPGPS